MQRLIFVALSIAVLILAGCSPDDGQGTKEVSDTTWYEGPDTTDPIQYRGVRILTPQPDEIHTLHYRWDRHNPDYPCSWNYYMTDSLRLTAQVMVDVPGGVQRAELWVQTYGSFGRSGPMIYPTADTFEVVYYQDYPHWENRIDEDDTLTMGFYVRVTAGNGSQWLGSVVEYHLIERLEPPVSSPPAAPVADSLYEVTDEEGRGRILAWRWCNPSPGAPSALFYLQNSFDGAIEIDTLPYYNVDLGIYRYLPLTTYRAWMTLANEFGTSPPSDTLEIQTVEPAPPGNLTALVYYPEREVRVCWNYNRQADSLLVARRDLQSDWVIIDARSQPTYSNCCEDTTALPQTQYYYRVGAQFRNGTWWSRDSVAVLTL